FSLCLLVTTACTPSSSLFPTRRSSDLERLKIGSRRHTAYFWRFHSVYCDNRAAVSSCREKIWQRDALSRKRRYVVLGWPPHHRSGDFLILIGPRVRYRTGPRFARSLRRRHRYVQKLVHGAG